jgi:hypothetical protein
MAAARERIRRHAMTLFEILDPRISWRTLLAAVLLSSLAAGVGFWLWDPTGTREIGAKLRLGATESEVLQALGQLPVRVYDRATAPADYYDPGWFRRVPPITNRVLVFELRLLTCHVWIDAQGRVEDFAVRGS